MSFKSKSLVQNIGDVPGIFSCPVVDVVIFVPSQAAAWDTAGAIKSKLPAFNPLI